MTALRLTRPQLCGLALVVLCAGCVLPSFEAASGEVGDAGGLRRGDGGAELAACGRSAELPSACDLCIREHCCDEAAACDEGTECGDDMLEPITPVAEFSTDFDPLLGCMQRACNAQCEVDLGCLEDYAWPVVEEDVAVPVRVVDFAAEPDLPLVDFTVKACQAIDPACGSGEVTSVQTDAEGVAALILPPGFAGFFDVSGGDYADSTAQWSEPFHRLSGGFTHYMLKAQDVDALAVITGVHSETGMPFADGSGHLIFRIQGCLPMRYLANDERPSAELSGAHVMFAPNDFGADVFYTDADTGVSVTLEETSIDGVGGAFEAPARNITVIARDADGREIATGSVRVRPGAVGFAYLMPRSAR